jgi:hypothetical protein
MYMEQFATTDDEYALSTYSYRFRLRWRRASRISVCTHCSKAASRDHLHATAEDAM